MPFMSRLGNRSASLRGSVSSSASMRWIASGSPLTAAAMHARISSPSPAGRSAGSIVRAASASSSVRIRRAPDGHRHHAAHPRRGAAHHRVAQVGLGTIEQRHGMAEAPGQRRGDGGRHQALGAALGIGIELRRALQRAGGGRVPAAARGVVGGEDQRLGRLVVGGGGGGGAVPRAPVDVGLVVEHGGERLVRRTALGEARGAVDRRAHERMAEAQPRAIGGQQAGALGDVEGVGPEAQTLGGPQQRPDVAAVVGCRQHEQAARVVPERLDADHEGALDALVERQVQAQWRAARCARRR